MGETEIGPMVWLTDWSLVCHIKAFTRVMIMVMILVSRVRDLLFTIDLFL